MESERNTKLVLKELVKEWAEEKKKIATMQIELDCLRKLTKT